MNINIYINQKKINPLYIKGIDEYIKRLTPYCHLSVKCPPHSKSLRTDNKNTMNIIVTTGSHTDTATSQTAKNLDVSSEHFASMIGKAAVSGISHINFYTDCMQDIDNNVTRLHLCTLSVSEDMEVLMLSEQIYRAFAILNHITYHK